MEADSAAGIQAARVVPLNSASPPTLHVSADPPGVMCRKRVVEREATVLEPDAPVGGRYLASS
jgi:hypothetical protein